MKTYQPKESEVKRAWHLVDAKDQILGRLATRIAMILMGKTKANYSAHMDSGDNVVVINAKDIKVTGKKESQKVYRGHSGYPKGFKEVSYQKMKLEHPGRIIEHAVDGMLPDNRLKDKRMRRLFVFEGENHSFGAKLNG